MAKMRQGNFGNTFYEYFFLNTFNPFSYRAQLISVKIAFFTQKRDRVFLVQKQEGLILGAFERLPLPVDLPDPGNETVAVYVFVWE